MSDLISRKRLYKKVAEMERIATKRVLDTKQTVSLPSNVNPSYMRNVAHLNAWSEFKHMIADFPSAQPTQLTDEDKETIRIHLSAFKENLCNQRRWNEAKEYEELISRLLSTPSVQPRKGKWIKCISQFGWRCSACNQIDKYAYSYTLGEGDYNTLQDYFCPNCGADMRQRGDSE